jgi:conjugative transposon TraN protein
MIKKISIILLCAFTGCVNAQVKQVATKRLEISYDKTLHIIFDNNVKYIDATQDIVPEINPTLPNIVKVKVNNENFTGTRGLSIITSDGAFHSFEVVYNANVKYSTYYAAKKDSSIQTTINVTTNKSTHLIFPHKVIYSDVGNEESLVSETISSSNILKIKSLTEEKLLPSSLFVVTDDKKYYEFLMNNDSTASTYTYNFCPTEDAAIFDNTTNDKILAEVAEKCLKERKMISSVGERKNQLTCFLNNVNINNDVLYFTFEIINSSTLNMDIDFIRCFIKDKKTIKNSPEQEIESTPLITYKYQTVIGSNNSNCFVLAFPKFTIPDKKKFEVQIFDKDGGRHLSFSIKDDLIINAKPI